MLLVGQHCLFVASAPVCMLGLYCTLLCHHHHHHGHCVYVWCVTFALPCQLAAPSAFPCYVVVGHTCSLFSSGTITPRSPLLFVHVPPTSSCGALCVSSCQLDNGICWLHACMYLSMLAAFYMSRHSLHNSNNNSSFPGHNMPIRSWPTKWLPPPPFVAIHTKGGGGLDVLTAR